MGEGPLSKKGGGTSKSSKHREGKRRIIEGRERKESMRRHRTIGGNVHVETCCTSKKVYLRMGIR